MVWAPHGHAAGVDALRRLANIVLIDSQDEPEVRAAFERAADLTGSAYVVDLAWLRSTPWRERVAATFDPPPMRRSLGAIDKVVVRHRTDSTAAAALFCGWLASRLGWRPEALGRRGDHLTGHARARRGEVTIELHPEDMGAPGLAGVTIEMASGEAVSLDRGPGGLRAARRARDGQRAGVDGARRLARRGGDPRRGRPPGAAARPDVRAGARGGQGAGRMTAARPRSAAVPSIRPR